MTLNDVPSIIAGRLISKRADLDAQVTMACGADLMSDALAFTCEDTMLLTGLTTPQVIRTAEMAGVRGKIPPIESISQAEQQEIPL